MDHYLMFTDLDQFIREQLERFNQGQSDINDGIGPNDSGSGGFNPFGGRISFGTGVGGLGVSGGVNGTGIFSDPGNVLSQIISPSRSEVVGELIDAGIVSPGTVFANPNIFVDVKNDNGEVIGEINRTIIDDAVAGLPTPDISGQRPPTQTGGGGDSSGDAEDKPPSVNDVNGEPVVNEGNGQIPNAPSRGPTSDTEFDPFGILDSILNGRPIISTGGSTVSQVPTSDSGFGLDDILGTIFGTGTEASNSNQNSNVISDLIGAITGGSADNALSNIIDFGISDYVADQQLEANRDSLDFYREIYGDQIDRLEPFRLAGKNALPALSAATTTNPRPRNLDGVPLPEAGRRPVTLGDSTAVSVNEFNPYDVNDPILQSIIESGANAIDASQVARGKLNSGETLEQLQEMGQNAALRRAGQVQAIEATRDGLDLASQGQSFGQTTTNANLTKDLNERDFINSLIIGDTDFNRKVTANNFDLGFDKHKFGKLYDTTRVGQNSAAQQGAGSSSFGITGANIIGQEGDIRTARTSGFTNALAGFF